MLAFELKACFNFGMDYEKIISSLGGPSEVARICEVAPQAVSQWFGADPQTGEKRVIPKARLMFLKVVRPDVFQNAAPAATQTDGA